MNTPQENTPQQSPESEAAFQKAKTAMREYSLIGTIEQFKQELQKSWTKEIPPAFRILNSYTEETLVDQVLEQIKEYEKPEVLVCSKADFEYLQTCKKLLEADRGCFTPAESFISYLLHIAGTESLTPKNIEIALEEFRTNFNQAIQVVEYMNQKYPKAS